MDSSSSSSSSKSSSSAPTRSSSSASSQSSHGSSSSGSSSSSGKKKKTKTTTTTKKTKKTKKSSGSSLGGVITVSVEDDSSSSSGVDHPSSSSSSSSGVDHPSSSTEPDSTVIDSDSHEKEEEEKQNQEEEKNQEEEETGDTTRERKTVRFAEDVAVVIPERIPPPASDMVEAPYYLASPRSFQRLLAEALRVRREEEDAMGDATVWDAIMGDLRSWAESGNIEEHLAKNVPLSRRGPLWIKLIHFLESKTEELDTVTLRQQVEETYARLCDAPCVVESRLQADLTTFFLQSSGGIVPSETDAGANPTLSSWRSGSFNDVTHRARRDMALPEKDSLEDHFQNVPSEAKELYASNAETLSDRGSSSGDSLSEARPSGSSAATMLRSLTRVIRAVMNCEHRKESPSEYHTGLFFVAVVLLASVNEADAYYLLDKMMRLPEFGGILGSPFSDEFPLAQHQLIQIVTQVCCPSLNGVSLSMMKILASSWLCTQCFCSMPLVVCTRIMTRILFQGCRAVFQTAATLLSTFEQDVLFRESEQTLSFFYNDAVSRLSNADAFLMRVPAQIVSPEHLEQFSEEYKSLHKGVKDPRQLFVNRTEIGESYHGSTMKATDTRTDETVAFKLLLLSKSSTKNSVQELQREVKLLETLKSPFLVPYLDYLMVNPVVCIIMRHVEGGNLVDLIYAQKMSYENHLFERNDVREAAEFDVEDGNPFGIRTRHISLIAREVLSGLDFLHSKGFFHGSLKATNVIISSTGQVMLCDYSVAAKLVNDAADDSDDKKKTPRPNYDPSIPLSVMNDLKDVGILCLQLGIGNVNSLTPEEVEAMSDTAAGKFSGSFHDFIQWCTKESHLSKLTAATLRNHPFITKLDKGLRQAGWQNATLLQLGKLIMKWRARQLALSKKGASMKADEDTELASDNDDGDLFDSMDIDDFSGVYETALDNLTDLVNSFRGELVLSPNMKYKKEPETLDFAMFKQALAKFLDAVAKFVKKSSAQQQMQIKHALDEDMVVENVEMFMEMLTKFMDQNRLQIRYLLQFESATSFAKLLFDTGIQFAELSAGLLEEALRMYHYPLQDPSPFLDVVQKLSEVSRRKLREISDQLDAYHQDHREEPVIDPTPTSLEKVFSDPFLLEGFSQYLSRLKADSPLVCWFACEEYRVRLKTEEESLQKATSIFDAFFTIKQDSMSLLPMLPTIVASNLMQEILEPTPLTFVPVQKSLLDAMETMHLAPYLASPEFVEAKLRKLEIKLNSAREEQEHLFTSEYFATEQLKQAILLERMRQHQLKLLPAPAKIRPDSDLLLKQWSVRPMKFNGRWSTTSFVAAEDVEVSRLKLATYNVTRLAPSAERYQEVLELLECVQADIYALQEVTVEFLMLLTHCEWVRQKYYISDAVGRTLKRMNHGQLILSRFQFDRLQVQELRSREQRIAILGKFLINRRSVGVASLQLDSSVGDDVLRQDQLVCIIGALRGLNCDDLFLLGDVQSSLEVHELIQVDAAVAFYDVWTQHAVSALSHWPPGKKIDNSVLIPLQGYTVDPDHNPFAKDLEMEVGRPDRILLYTERYWTRMKGVGLIGRKEVTREDDVEPSAHYGLCVSLEPTADDEGGCIVM